MQQEGEITASSRGTSISASEECSINQLTAGSTPQLWVLKTALLALWLGKPCKESIVAPSTLCRPAPRQVRLKPQRSEGHYFLTRKGARRQDGQARQA